MIGPKKFLSRLEPYIEVYDFIVVNPDKFGFIVLLKNYLKSKKINILLRCDGLNFVRLSEENIVALCEVKHWNNRVVLNTLLFIFGVKKSTIIFNLWLNRYSLLSYLLARKVVFQSALSKQMYRVFNPFYSDSKKSIIINNGIGRTVPISDVIDLSVFCICISANPFRPHKRLLDAVNIVLKLILLRPNIDFRLVVFGRVPDNVRITNFNFIDHYSDLSEGDYLAKLSKCHVMLSLALFDPCPNVVVEALSFGLPVMTPQQSGAFELIGNKIDWAVDEEHSLDYCDFQLEDFVRIKPEKLDIYINKLLNLLEDYNNQRQMSLKLYERLKIDKIASEYIRYAAS